MNKTVISMRTLHRAILRDTLRAALRAFKMLPAF
jgi:hypothetical protein